MSAFSVTDLAFEPEYTDFWTNYRRIKQFYYVCCQKGETIYKSSIEKLIACDDRLKAKELYEELAMKTSSEDFAHLPKITSAMSLEEIEKLATSELATPRVVYFTTTRSQSTQTITFTNLFEQRATATLEVGEEVDSKKARRKRIRELKLKSGQLRR